MIIGHIMEKVIPYITGTLEMTGVMIIAIATIKAVYYLIKSKFDINNSIIRIEFAKALTFSLEFKLGSEILKTVIIRTWNEVMILSAIVILRVIMTVIIHWEIKNEEKLSSKE
ncbi:DUF1622 domain-containing protein [Leptotrichia sp. OH3620_COT-345]|uniref:DUF1622 domain-containing protein n=1 Tax=Leptotrichia sp. OH3620_COT-345 TaxID=2491048 RepID=UPI000F655D10|nr:DUF1622 domain-containing protein [Leptotrichia sp. OH3620_COT-345]RRD38860.1 DUF1622 domain-containing protein [Leptotrichia sp. OH3620_COT-345]